MGTPLGLPLSSRIGERVQTIITENHVVRARPASSIAADQ